MNIADWKNKWDQLTTKKDRRELFLEMYKVDKELILKFYQFYKEEVEDNFEYPYHSNQQANKRRLPEMKHDVWIKDDNVISRGKVIDVDHPDQRWALVEYDLPFKGRKTYWVLKTNIKPAYFMNAIDASLGGSSIKVDFIREQNFNPKPNTPIDIFGYMYLDQEDEDKLWKKFRDKKPMIVKEEYPKRYDKSPKEWADIK